MIGELLLFFFFQMCTPANTPVTPPSFPDALSALAKLSASDKTSHSITQATPPPPPPPSLAQVPPASRHGPECERGLDVSVSTQVYSHRDH